MCGLVGMRTTKKTGFYSKDRDILRGMLVVNSLRGSHSTGVAGIPRFEGDKEKVSILKAVNSPFNLFEWKKWDVFSGRILTQFGLIMGHGRYATRGAINAINAHPFEEGHITLAHNGNISNFFSLRDKKLDKDIDVDSHLVARLFERESWEKVLPTLKGAYALTWYDSRDGSLHIARNDKRPLWVAVLKDKDTMLWASEKATLLWVAERYNLEYEDLYEINTHTHYMWEWGETKPHIKKYEVQEDNDVVTYWKRTPLEEEKFRASGVWVGKEITMYINDVIPQRGSVRPMSMIKGSSAEFPAIEFRVLVDADHQYAEGGFLTAFVANLYPASRENTFNHADWVAYLTRPKEKIDALVDNFVKVETIDGNIHSIPQHRYFQMLKHCAWCQKEVRLQDPIRDADKVFYWEDDTDEDGILCQDCTGSCFGPGQDELAILS